MSRKNGAGRKLAAPPRRRVLAMAQADGLYLRAEEERALENRLSRLEGQVRGIKRMLAQHESCDLILMQIAALKQAVNAVAAELVAAHMETCVLGRVEAGEAREALESLREALGTVLKHG